jgi:hypothetical protein
VRKNLQFEPLRAQSTQSLNGFLGVLRVLCGKKSSPFEFSDKLLATEKSEFFSKDPVNPLAESGISLSFWTLPAFSPTPFPLFDSMINVELALLLRQYLERHIPQHLELLARLCLS